jgi:hypothetical protein
MRKLGVNINKIGALGCSDFKGRNFPTIVKNPKRAIYYFSPEFGILFLEVKTPLEEGNIVF